MKQFSQNANWKRPFFTIWGGQQLSLVGSYIAQFALVWWITETTDSATVLAGTMLAATLPSIIFGLFIGALVDRWSRRLVLIAADGLVALASAVLVLLFWNDAIEIWHVYLILFVRSIGNTFHFPAMSATTPLMVPKEYLPRVAGLNQTMSGALNVISPLLGALVLGFLAIYVIMLIDVLTAVFAIAPLFFIAVPESPRSAQADPSNDPSKQAKPSVWADMQAGFRYVWGWPGLKAIVFLAMILNFLVNPVSALMPLLITQHFGGAAIQLGWMNAGWGVGLIAGGLILTVWGGFQRRMVTMLMGVIGLGVGILVVGLVPATLFPLALLGFSLGAVMNSMSNAALFAVLQQVIAPEMQGRVFALGGSLANAAMPLGLAIAGLFADAVGIRVLYIVAGGLYILVGSGSFLIRALVYIEDD